MHEDNPQDKVANDKARDKSQPNESNPMVIMERQLQLAESRFTQQDQFNDLLLGKMTRMKPMKIALTKLSLDMLAPPIADALEKEDLKDPGTSGIYKDKVKRIVVEELK
uniref:Uncharacterized protein n=1 Tax=Cannabis sativa TaxID=3483 RepID=A0A803QCH5_CANSA